MGPIRGRERDRAGACSAASACSGSRRGWHRLDVTLVALPGISVLFITNILHGRPRSPNASAWDVFVWYGGLMTMGEVLNDTGSTTAFAGWVGSWFIGVPWFSVLLLTLLIYFYAHYAFASITTHVLAMFPPFAVMLIGVGVPPALTVYSLACLANLTAGLTHYGTTTGADRVRRELRHVRRLVARRLRRVGRQPGDLADGRLRVVESPRPLVALRPRDQRNAKRRRGATTQTVSAPGC